MASEWKVCTRKPVVLTGAFFSMFLSIGFPFNMSVLNVVFLRYFGETKTVTALIQAVATGILDLAGIAGGQLVNKYGARKVGMMGGLLAFLGLSCSFFATNISYLIISLGVITGLGFSLVFVSSSTAVGEYFSKKSKLFAMAFTSAGSGFGGMLFPFLLEYLIEIYGWRGCLLIVGGIMANMICFFAVCKPVSVGTVKSKLGSWCSQDVCNAQTSNRLQEATTFTDHGNIEIPRGQPSCTEKLRSLKRNPVFIIFVLGMSLTISSFGASMIYMLEFLQTKGLNEHEALLLYFYMNISATFGRLIPGLCILIPFMDGLIVTAISSSLGCLTSVGLLRATTNPQHVILMSVYGMAFGCVNTGITMTTMELVGLDQFAIGMTILMPALGVLSICAGAVTGWFVDMTGSYQASYYFLTAGQSGAFTLFILALILRKCKQIKTCN